MYQNFIAIPIILKLLVVVGLMAPILVVGSTLTGTIISDHTLKPIYGAASDIIEISIVALCSIPSFVAAIMMLIKISISRFIYILGWILISLSPLSLSIVREDYRSYLLEAGFYLILGLIIAMYLFKERAVNSYFSQ